MGPDTGKESSCNSASISQKPGDQLGREPLGGVKAKDRRELRHISREGGGKDLQGKILI